jgi:hypothetical protein
MPDVVDANTTLRQVTPTTIIPTANTQPQRRDCKTGAAIATSR